MVESGFVVSAHAWQLFAICWVAGAYFLGRHFVVRWWRKYAFILRMADLIDIDKEIVHRKRGQ